MVRQYSLKYIGATNAVSKFNATPVASQNVTHIDGLVVRPFLVVVPIEETNPLVIVAAEDEHQRVSKLPDMLHVTQALVEIECTVARISEDGNREVIAPPPDPHTRQPNSNDPDQRKSWRSNRIDIHTQSNPVATCNEQ